MALTPTFRYSAPVIPTPYTARVAASSSASSTATKSVTSSDAQDGLRMIAEVVRDLEDLDDLVRLLQPGSERSQLDLTGTGSTLASTRKVSRSPTMVDRVADTATGDITAGWKLRFQGAYTGLTDANIELRVTPTSFNLRPDGLGLQPGTVGLTPGFKVYINGVESSRLDFEVGDPIGTTRYHESGFGVTIGLEDAATFGASRFDSRYTIAASAGTFDADTAFDAATGAKFETGEISTGSFELNGVSIAVNADDTLNELLTRINESSAGVTASYDSTTQQVSLQRTDDGVEPITVENDSSGIVAALQLAGATSVPGSEGDLDRPIASVSALSDLTTGTFTINGQTVAVDKANDTIRSVLTKIQATGVDAEFDRSTQKIRWTIATKPTDGTSNFASAFLTPSSGDSARVAGQLQTRLEKLGRKLQAIEDVFGGVFTDGLRTAIGSRVGLKDGQRSGAVAGLKFDFDASDPARVLTINDTALKSAARNPRTLRSLLRGNGVDDAGLLGELKSGLETAGRRLTDRYGAGGGFSLFA